MGHFIRFLAVVMCATASMNIHAARHALVIGNDSYAHAPPLNNARADARAVARALEGAGFRVTLALDQSRGGMNSTVRRFKASLSGGDEAVFFYAGHGVQLGGANYLLPIDLHGEDEEQVKDDAIQLQRILDDLAEQRVRFSLAIIDACRDNPFKGKGRSFGVRGLAPTSAANGQMVIFSAGAGQQALDRLGEKDREVNSVFTRVLLAEIVRGGQPVDRALKAVRTEVVRLAKSVGHDQVPAIYDQSIGDFYFRTPIDTRQQHMAVHVPKPPDTASTPAPTKSSETKEEALWDVVSSTNTADDYEAFLQKFPAGRRAEDARRALAGLKEEQSAKIEKESWARADKMATVEGYRSFLSAYPDSTYSALAQSRLQRLERAKMKLAAECAGCPMAGDVWEYEFVDGFTGPKGKLKYTIQSAESNEVVEMIESQELLLNTISRRVPLSGGAPGALMIQKLKLASESWWLLEPNLYAVLSGAQKRELRKGDRIEMKALDRSCSGEILGNEEITVPAGRFSTRKLQVKCALPATHFFASAFLGFHTQLDLTVWIDPVRYRPIKVHKSLPHGRERELDELRLVSVSRASEAPAQ